MLVLKLALWAVTMWMVWILFQTMNEVRGGNYKSNFYKQWDQYGFGLIGFLGLFVVFETVNLFIGAVFLLFLHPYAAMKWAKVDAYLANGGVLKYSRLQYALIGVFIITFSLVFTTYYSPENLYIRGLVDIVAVGLIAIYRFKLRASKTVLLA